MAIPQTIVYTKSPSIDLEIFLDSSKYLQVGEVIDSISVQNVYPNTAEMLGITFIQTSDTLHISGGLVDTSYGANIVIDCSGRPVIVPVAILVTSSSGVQINKSVAINTLVDEIKAGDSAESVATFILPPDAESDGGLVAWALLNNDGDILNQGNAYKYIVQQTNSAKIIRATCIINVPSNVEPTPYGEKYQIQYTLTRANEYDQVVAENITILGYTNTPLGTANMVEMAGTSAIASLVTDKHYDHVQIGVYIGNQVSVEPVRVLQHHKVDTGVAWSHTISLPSYSASLIPRSVLWTYWDHNNPAAKYTEHAKLLVINASILDAIDDVQARVNKARASLFGGPEMLFPPDVVLIWLRRGADYFNGAHGKFTNFTFTNALGILREFWLSCAEMFALESQELAEGEKAFNYSGANISLDVDRTQAYATAADRIRSRLDQEMRPVKENLIIKGHISGDGSADITNNAPGSLGAVGVTITPASTWGIMPNIGPKFR